MTLIQLDEIGQIIEKFQGSQRGELARFYVETARKRLTDPIPIKRRKIYLLRHILIFSDKKEHAGLIEEALQAKTLQTRALILDLIASNYSLEQRNLYKPEGWLETIIRDVRDTFSFPADQPLFRHYNSLLCREFEEIFISCQKFNTAGNQLLLNLITYKGAFSKHTPYDFDGLIARFTAQFNPNKRLPLDTLHAIYAEYEAEQSRAREKRRAALTASGADE